MLKRRDQEHSEVRMEIAAKTVETVLPLLKKAQSRANGSTREYMETAQANLLDVFSEHPHDSILTTAKLAPRELQIVHYIRQNKTTKEIGRSPWPLRQNHRILPRKHQKKTQDNK